MRQVPQFQPEQVAAIRTLSALWPGIPLCLVGASALACHTGLWWRTTVDLDLCVALSLDRFPGKLAALEGWAPHPSHEHEWYGPGNVRVDLIPAGPALLASRRIVWPKSGFEMSLVGFRHVFTQSTPVEIAPGVPLQVVSVPVLTLLKMVAYLDRPHERGRDLQDIAWALADHLAADDDRRWTDEVLAAGVDFEGASAFVLGRDLRELLDEDEATIVRKFLQRAGAEADGAGTQRRLLEAGPASLRDDPASFLRALDAFESGAFPK